jgi:membrane associated rhomboid family serine protease
MEQDSPDPTSHPVEELQGSDRRRVLTSLACAACVLVFVGLLQERNPDSWDTLSSYGYYPSNSIWNGKYWALITSVFVHRALWHCAFNVYWLWVLGGTLERVIGPLRFLAFFLTAAIVSSGIEFAISGSTGIGASGVVYAMFGFMWIAGGRINLFKKAMPKRIIVLFLGWAVICILATLSKTMNIGNAAHISGLLFGAGVAGLFVLRKQRPFIIAGLGNLILIAVIPLFWCPWSPGWVAKQGYDAHARHDYAKAVSWYQRTIDLGGDQAWALENMALAYSSMDDKSRYEETVERLRQLDQKAADEIERTVKGGSERK